MKFNVFTKYDIPKNLLNNQVSWFLSDQAIWLLKLENHKTFEN